MEIMFYVPNMQFTSELPKHSLFLRWGQTVQEILMAEILFFIYCLVGALRINKIIFILKFDWVEIFSMQLIFH
jgi:hypothetical protein